MASSRYINTFFWNDPYIADKLDPIEKLLYMYFLTNELTNLAGVYEIAIRKVSFDTGIDKEMVLRILERFQRDKKMYYFEKHIIISNFIKNQNLNGNMIKGALSILENLPESVKYFIFDKLNLQTANRYETIRKALKGFGNDLKGLPNGSEGFRTLSSGHSRNETEEELNLKETNVTLNNNINNNNSENQSYLQNQESEQSDEPTSQPEELRKSINKRLGKKQKFIRDNLKNKTFKPNEKGLQPRIVNKNEIDRLLEKKQIDIILKYYFYTVTKKPKYFASYLFYAIESKFTIPDYLEDEIKMKIKRIV